MHFPPLSGIGKGPGNAGPSFGPSLSKYTEGKRTKTIVEQKIQEKQSLTMLFLFDPSASIRSLRKTFKRGESVELLRCSPPPHFPPPCPKTAAKV